MRGRSRDLSRSARMGANGGCVPPFNPAYGPELNFFQSQMSRPPPMYTWPEDSALSLISNRDVLRGVQVSLNDWYIF